MFILNKKEFSQRDLFIIPLILLLLFSSCEEKALFNAGEDIFLTYQTDTFSVLEVNDIFDIVLHSSDINKIEVEGGSNLLEDFDFYTVESKLFIENSQAFRWSKGYDRIKINIFTTSLSRINIRNPCKIETNGPFTGDKLEIIDYEKFSELNMELDVKEFRIFVSSDNAGMYTFYGKAETAHFRPWGSSFIYAADLHVQKASVHHSSIGDCFVNASETLTIKMDEKGRVYYFGNPDTIIQKNTHGEIIHLSE